MTAGSTNKPHWIIEHGERICTQYGVTEKDVYPILQAEKEIAQCEGCTGLPCQKKSNKFVIPRVITDELPNYTAIRYFKCQRGFESEMQAKIDKMQGLSKIPPEYVGKTFADYDVDERNNIAVEMAKRLIERPDKGAYFFGNVGTGKTLLAAITAQEIIKRGRQVIFATVPAISKQLRSTFGSNSKTTEAEILEQLETAQTLILDDVGMEKPTRFVCSTLCNLFNERYNSRLQTIMTSNYTLKQLADIFNNPTDGGTTLDGTRIYDRCKQMCMPVELKGESRRV